MDRSQIIREVVRIILEHAKPERIYLFGSHVSGEAKPTSDIDIAYDDPDSKEHAAIEDEVGSIATLLKIDIKNIAKTSDRFRNRVLSTGRVLFSANKKLRAEDGLYNFSKALSAYSNVVDRKEEFYQEGFSDVYLDIVVRRFEFTYEMSWKAIKRYLDHIGIDAKSPRSCFQEAHGQGLIGKKNKDLWLSMIESRNISSHMYDRSEVEGILEKMIEYRDAFVELRDQIGRLLENQS